MALDKYRSFFITAIVSLNFSCSRGQESDLKNNAVPNDKNSRVIKVRDGQTVFPALLTGNGSSQKAYKIECHDDFGAPPFDIIEALGYDIAKYSLLQEIDINSSLLSSTGLKDKSSPVLNCKAGEDPNNSLFKVKYDQTTKYYVSFNDHVEGEKSILNMIGCSALIEQLGFSIANALELTPSSAEYLSIRDDIYDINCIKGVPAGYQPKLSWNPIQNPNQSPVELGAAITPVVIEARFANQENFRISYGIQESNCSWIGLSSNVLFGTVPGNSVVKECKVIVKAYSPENISIDPIFSEPIIIQTKTVEASLDFSHYYIDGSTSAIPADFTKDGKSILFQKNGKLIDFNIEAKTSTTLTFDAAETIYGLACSADKSFAAVILNDGKIEIWDTFQKKSKFKTVPLVPENTYYKTVRFSPWNDSALVYTSNPAKISVVEVGTERVSSLDLGAYTIYSAEFLNNKEVAILYSDSSNSGSTLEVWNFVDGKRTSLLQTSVVLNEIKVNQQRLGFSEFFVYRLNSDKSWYESYYLFTNYWGSSYTDVQKFDPSARHYKGISAFSFINSNSLAYVTGGLDGKVIVWKDGITKAFEFNHDAGVASLLVSKDGKSIFVGTHNGVIWLWDIVTGKLKAKINDSFGQKFFLHLSPDEKHLMSSYFSLEMWDLSNGI